MHASDRKKFKEVAKKAGVSEESYAIYKELSQLILDVQYDLDKRAIYWTKRARVHTTVGGSATEEVSIPKAKSSSVCFAQIRVPGAAPVTLDSARCETGKVVLEFSADPSNDHEINIIVI